MTINLQHDILKNSSKLYIWTLKYPQFGISVGVVVLISVDDVFPILGVPITEDDTASLCIFETACDKHVISMEELAVNTKYELIIDENTKTISLVDSDGVSSDIILPTSDLFYTHRFQR